MALQTPSRLRIPAQAKRWFALQIIRQVLLGGFLALILLGFLLESIPLLVLGSLLLLSEITTAKKIGAQLDLILRQVRSALTSRAIALRYDLDGREEIESVAASLAQIPHLENHLSRELPSRISLLITTPILAAGISGGYFFFTETTDFTRFLISLFILLLIQALRWFTLPKQRLDLTRFFPGAIEATSRGEIDASTEEPDEGRTGKIGRIKEIRWTDCQLQGDESAAAFRWGLAPAGRITAVISKSPELRRGFVEALIDPWSLEIGRIFVDTNRETYRVDQLHRNQWQNEIGLISSSPRFASLSIEANMKAIKPRATRERLGSLIKEVGLDSELLPEGLSTHINDDSSLFSPSLRRRVALARVLLKDPSLVVLDLACRDCDEATEGLLIQGMRDLAAAGKVVILISETILDSTITKKQFDLDALAPTLIPQVSV